MTVEIVGIIVLAFCLAVVLSAYDRLQRKTKKMKAEQELIEGRARQKAYQLVEEAKNRALEIMQRAIEGTQVDQESLEKKLSEVSQKQLDKYKDILLNISKDIEVSAKKDLDELQAAIKQETVGVQQNAAQKRMEAYELVDKEIQNYKDQRIADIEAKLALVLKDVSKVAVGMGLDYSQHGKLIEQALDEAKKAYEL